MEKDKLWTIDYIALILSQTMTSFGFQIVTTVLPLYLYTLGSAESEIGLVVGSFTFSAILIRPFSQFGINWIGKKRYLLCGILIMILAVSGYPLTSASRQVLLLRIVHGLGFGIGTTLMFTLVADTVPVSRRGEGIGYFGLGNTIAQSTGPFIALTIIAANRYKFAF